MRFASISALALAAALSTLTLSAVAVAQDRPSPPSAHQGWDGMREHREDHRAAHVKALHDALNIRPDQENAFNAAVAALHPQDAEHDRMGGDPDKAAGDHAAMAAMTTPERMDMMARKMDEHMTRMRDHMQRTVGAVKALYAVLSPDQRHTLDALSLLMGHEHRMGGMGSEHGMGGEHGMDGHEPE